MNKIIIIASAIISILCAILFIILFGASFINKPLVPDNTITDSIIVISIALLIIVISLLALLNRRLPKIPRISLLVISILFILITIPMLFIFLKEERSLYSSIIITFSFIALIITFLTYTFRSLNLKITPTRSKIANIITTIAIAAFTIIFIQTLIPKSKAQVYYNNGKAYYDQDKYEAAILEFTAAIEIDQHNNSFYHYRGNSYQLTRKYDQALTDYNQAISIKPEDA